MERKVRLAAWLITVLLLCLAFATARAQSPGNRHALTSSALWEAQLQYQRARIAAWHAAIRVAAEQKAAEERAIIRAQREYQNSRSLSWWRAHTNVYAGAQCPLRPADDAAIPLHATVRAAL